MRWLIFSASFASMFAFLFTLQSSPPVIPDIMREFGISHGEVSSVMTLVAIPGIFFSIPGAIFVDKYGSKKNRFNRIIFNNFRLFNRLLF